MAPDDLRIRTILQTVNKSRPLSKVERSRRPPLARARTLPSSRVHRVAMRLDSLQSEVRRTRAVAFSVDMGGLGRGRSIRKRLAKPQAAALEVFRLRLSGALHQR